MVEEYFYLLADLEVEKRDRGIDESIPLEYFDGDIWSDLSEGFLCYLSQLEYGLSLPLTNLVMGIMNAIGACPIQLNGNMWEVITVCYHLNKTWEKDGNVSRIAPKDDLQFYGVKNFKASGGSYFYTSITRRHFFDLNIAGRTWNDNIIWVKGNCLQRDEEEPFDFLFRTIKQSVKSIVERKESLLDKVAKEETELELVLKGLGLSRKKRVDSRSNKVRKAQSTRSMAMVDDGKRQESCWEALLASSTTGSSEITKDKRRRFEPSGESGEKIVEGRSATVDDLKEVEERARLAVPQGEEDTHKMVARLIKEIWLGIEEKGSELMKVNVELEKELARSRTDTLKEVRQLKASHTVAIGQLQVETKANLDEMVEERDRLGHHLILKGYSEEDMDAIKTGTYAVREMSFRINDLESELDRERETSKALSSAQAKLQVELDSSRSHEDDVLMCNQEFAEQFDRMKEAGENREDQYAKAYFRLVDLTQAISDLTIQVEEKDSKIKKGLKELAEVRERAEKFQSRVDAFAVKGKQADTVQYHIKALEQSEERYRSYLLRCRNEPERMRQKFVKKYNELRGHVQKGNANLREYQHKLDVALIREKVLEGEIKAMESLVKRKEELLKGMPTREELNAKIGRLRARVVDLDAMNLAESAMYIAKLEENEIFHAKVDTEMTELKNEYARMWTNVREDGDENLTFGWRGESHF
ncbi:hypothetical protein GIB67_013923 [Kingdonia uniflora]|uniref:Uncharacterized protein n=1 Tax=Kingdonia uniflora TaxID=39325 RepID=A0A7J7LDL5_9MAGN|nr:hypothetical protein GIB67_013923 [Kingdonia uniflora]